MVQIAVADVTVGGPVEMFGDDTLRDQRTHESARRQFRLGELLSANAARPLGLVPHVLAIIE